MVDIGKSNYSNRVNSFVNLDNKNKCDIFVYVSSDVDLLLELWFAELLGLNAFVGSILEYPECCINFYIEHIHNVNEKFQGDFAMVTYKNSDISRPFSHLTNNLVRYIIDSVVSHFPCSFQCKETMNLTEKYLATLRVHYPNDAQVIDRVLKYPVLYTEFNGVFFFPEAVLQGHSIKYVPELIIGSNYESKYYFYLSQGNKIRFLQPDRLEIYCQAPKIHTKPKWTLWHVG